MPICTATVRADIASVFLLQISTVLASVRDTGPSAGRITFGLLALPRSKHEYRRFRKPSTREKVLVRAALT